MAVSDIYDSVPIMKLVHGGDLETAEKTFGIKKTDWLDLSTGINPRAWPAPSMPEDVWRRLPTLDSELNKTARSYYQCDTLLAIPGSQFAISRLPTLFNNARVTVPLLGYQEHQHAWSHHGHTLQTYKSDELDEVTDKIKAKLIDIVIAINPNNPSCDVLNKDQLIHWSSELEKNKGYLIVDETFMDTMPEYSMISSLPMDNVIILRSIGKFYGLAGLRLGFVIAANHILDKITAQLDPWAVSGPAQWVGIQALTDIAWQKQNRNWLCTQAKLMYDYLRDRFANEIINIAYTPLFITLTLSINNADHYYNELAKRGILSRHISYTDKHALIRLGLTANDEQWNKLTAALDEIKIES